MATCKLIIAALVSLVAVTSVKAENTEKVTQQTLPNYLKKLGYKVEEVPTEIGAPMCKVTFERGGFTFEIHVTVTKTGAIRLTAPLGNVPEGSEAATKISNLLELNDDINPCSFSQRDGKINMLLTVTDTSDAGFESGMDLLTEAIQRTYPIWNE